MTTEQMFTIAILLVSGSASIISTLVVYSAKLNIQRLEDLMNLHVQNTNTQIQWLKDQLNAKV